MYFNLHSTSMMELISVSSKVILRAVGILKIKIKFFLEIIEITLLAIAFIYI